MKLRRGVSKNQDYRGLFEDWEIAIARNLVNRFRAAWDSLNQVDIEDLMQECLLHWYQKKNKYNPDRNASIKTFMSRVVRNKLTDLVREYDTDKRKVSSQVVSLDQPIGDDDQTTLLDKFEDDMESNLGHDHSLTAGASIDLENAISVLNPKQRELCRLLGPEGLTVLEASEYLKTPRTTIYDELKRIKEIFKKKGLDQYL